MAYKEDYNIKTSNNLLNICDIYMLFETRVNRKRSSFMQFECSSRGERHFMH
jgi:hypothetical protein